MPLVAMILGMLSGCGGGSFTSFTSDEKFHHRETLAAWFSGEAYVVLEDGSLWEVSPDKTNGKMQTKRIESIPDAMYVADGKIQSRRIENIRDVWHITSRSFSLVALTRQGKMITVRQIFGRNQVFDVEQPLLGYVGRTRGLLLTTTGLTEVPEFGKQRISAVGKDVVDMTVEEGYSLALKSDGTVWGAFPQNITPDPVQVAGLPKIVQIASAEVMGFALGVDGSWWVWEADTHTPGYVPKARRVTGVPSDLKRIDLAQAIDAQGNVFQVERNALGSSDVKSDGPVQAIAVPGLPCPVSSAAHLLDSPFKFISCQDGRLFYNTTQYEKQYVQVVGLGKVAVPKSPR